MNATATQPTRGPGRFLGLLQKVSARWPTADDLASFELNPRGAAEHALEWIRRAHDRAGDGGISKGYDLVRGRWSPSYPETTGYTITSILNAASVLARPELSTLAVSLADHLLGVRTPEGGVSHWAAETPHPIVFDTGQVLFGWLAAFKATGDQRYLDAAVRAGAWLAGSQDATGRWTTHQHLGVAKVIDARVSWALIELYRVTRSESVLQAARRNLEWVLTQQQPDGWFRNCAFTSTEDPYTHTLAYTAEGLLESGLLLEEPRYIAAATVTADALLSRQHANGHLRKHLRPGLAGDEPIVLPDRQLPDEPTVASASPTNRPRGYRLAARKAVAFVAWTQAEAAGEPEIHGGIAGSFPVQGRYERFKYPNWAAKFFVDALLALDRFETRGAPLSHVG